MNLSIFLGCPILLFLSHLCMGYSSQDCAERRQSVIRNFQVIHNSRDADSKIKNTQYLVALYNRVSRCMPPGEKQRLDRLVEENTELVLFDGKPLRGGSRRSKYDGGELTDADREKAVGFFDELGGTLFNWLHRSSSLDLDYASSLELECYRIDKIERVAETELSRPEENPAGDRQSAAKEFGQFVTKELAALNDDLLIKAKRRIYNIICNLQMKQNDFNKLT